MHACRSRGAKRAVAAGLGGLNPLIDGGQWVSRTFGRVRLDNPEMRGRAAPNSTERCVKLDTKLSDELVVTTLALH